MIRNLYILIIISIVAPSFAQEWVRTFTSNQGGGFGARGVIESYDKGFIILSDAGNYKLGLIIKTGINGFERWKKFIGSGYYHIIPESIEQTFDNGYIVASTMSKYGTNDAFILKLNACFDKEWCKVLHTDNYYADYGQDVKQLPDGGYVVLTRYYEGIDPGNRIHLHKLDQYGELIWQNNFADNDTLLFGEEGFNLLIINSNEYLITGYGYYPDSGQYMGWRRPLLIKVDSTGNTYWETIWGTTNYFYGKPWYNSIVDNKGDIYNMGYRVGENARFPVLIKTGNDGQELFYSELVDTCYDGAAASPTWMEDSLIYSTVGWQNWDQSWF